MVNEVLIDVVEFVNVTMDKHWNHIRSDIVGHVNVKCTLSGMPDLTMFIHMPHPFLHYNLHQCAIGRRKRISDDNSVSFTPCDGNFVVMKY
mmetsp:Transcript_5497/g.701  ORF Transcript_5497/g.701 Transcript_5497/m.701 type:complete len:91 (-) Transcript_5497:466-738(-)